MEVTKCLYQKLSQDISSHWRWLSKQCPLLIECIFMIIVSRIMFHSYFIALRKEKWQSSMWKQFQNGLKYYYDEFS